MKLKACWRGHRPDVHQYQRGEADDPPGYLVACMPCGVTTSSKAQLDLAIREWNDDSAAFWDRASIQFPVRDLKARFLRWWHSRTV